MVTNSATRADDLARNRTLTTIIKGSAWVCVLIGFVLLFLFLVLEMAFFEPGGISGNIPSTEHLGRLFLHSVVRFLELAGVAFFVLGLIHILVETEGWSDYFRERIKQIVMQQSYLNTLDKDRLMALQASLLKAQFKNPQIDREGSFFNYLNTNLHPYIASPYRQDVNAEVIYTDAGDCWDVFDKVTYICKKGGTSIQQDVAFRADLGEYESIESFEIKAIYPYTHKDAGKNIPLHKPEQPKPTLGERFEVSLEQYKDIDGLMVVTTHRYKVRKERFQFWTMTHPTKNFNITLRYPEGYKVQWKAMVLSPELSQSTEADGYFSAKYDFWMLPESGMTWLITRKKSGDVLAALE